MHSMYRKAPLPLKDISISVLLYVELLEHLYTCIVKITYFTNIFALLKTWLHNTTTGQKAT